MLQVEGGGSQLARLGVGVSLLARLVASSRLDPGPRREALDSLARAAPDEVTVLADVFRIPALRVYVADVLAGAHLKIYDGGRRYGAWRRLRSAHGRWSSHLSDGPQYHVNGPFSHTILFGRLGPWTWLQLERHPLDPHHLGGHLSDWYHYQKTHETQGPYGTSPHDDSRPIQAVPPGSLGPPGAFATDEGDPPPHF